MSHTKTYAVPTFMEFARGANLRMFVLAIAILLPFAIADFQTFQLPLVLIFAIAIVGLNLLTGINGQISLGHSAFYAIGAYTTAILIDHYGMPYWATLPIAGAICLGF